jgi:abhydrolase domain-containing protein 6
MAGKPGMLLKLFALFCIAVGIALVVATWLFFKRPLLMDAWFSRFALSAAGLEDHHVDGPTGRLTWFEGGHGDTTLVLLHGAGDQAGTWARTITPLVERYRVVVPDLAGHGKTDPKDGPIGVDQVLATASATLDQCCADQPVVLVGNSLGGWIAFLLAMERPDQVERIVAVNGGPLRHENPTVNLFPTNREEARQTMEALMGSSVDQIPGTVLDDIARYSQVGPAARLAETADAMEPFLLEGRLHEVTTPVDIIWGESDELLPLDYAQRLLDGLPAARMATIANCGHVPHRECPTLLVERLLGALNQAPPESVAAIVDSDEAAEDGGGTAP